MKFRLMTLFKCALFAGMMAMLGFVSVACGSQSARIPAATRTPYVITRLITVTPLPTETPSPSATPSRTLTPYPTSTRFILSSSKPSDLDVVRLILSRHLPPELVEITIRDVQNGNHRRFKRQEIDVNEDGLAEILITDEIPEMQSSYFAVIGRNATGGINENSQWQELFYFQESGHYCWDTRASFIQNRVILDAISCHGGTGDFAYFWDQHWIQCRREKCIDVWSARIFDAGRSYSARSTHDFLIGRIDQLDDHTIQLTTKRFKIDGVPMEDFIVEPARRITGPTIREQYRWSGSVFVLESTEQIEPGIEITREFNQEGNANLFLFNNLIEPLCTPVGVGACDFDRLKIDPIESDFWGMPAPNTDDPVWPSKDFSMDSIALNTKGPYIAGVVTAKDRPLCRLTVQQYVSRGFKLIGRVDVQCTQHFTRLFWIDVDGDGADELLMLTIPPNPKDSNVEMSARQRLHVYKIKDSLAEIANIDGAINGEDGVGIRWETGKDGFYVFAGLPLAIENCAWGFACVTLDRRFQKYRWNKSTNSLQPVQ